MPSAPGLAGLSLSSHSKNTNNPLTFSVGHVGAFVTEPGASRLCWTNCRQLCVCDIHLPGETWGTYWDHGRRWVWRGRLSLSLFSSSPKWLLLSCLVSLNITLDARTPRRSILPPVCAYRPAQLTLITQRQYCSKRALCGRPAAPRAPHCFFFSFSLYLM